MLVTSVSFFNDIATEKGNYAQGYFLIMASKRITLWKEHMSRIMTGVRRSGSSNPTEEITMSTTGSKLSEVEFMRDNAT